MNITRETYFQVQVYDHPGVITKLVEKLKEHNIDLTGLWGFATGHGNAEVILVPKSPHLFLEVLKPLGMHPKEGMCFRLSGADEVGFLVDTLTKIAAAGINVRAVDAIALSGQVCSFLWCASEDEARLSDVLGV